MVVKPEDICSEIEESLIQSGLFSSAENGYGEANSWRISPEPYFLSPQEVQFFSDLGHHLLKFYTVCNQFYLDSTKGRIPEWFANYLDIGKPTELINLGRMKRFKRSLPGIIRPDVIVTEDGFAVTELDSVPGGFGLTAGLMSLYGGYGSPMVGEEHGGIPELFYEMLESVSGARGCKVALLVSDEAKDYRKEMDHLGNLLKNKGFPVYLRHPSEVMFKEEGLFVKEPDGEILIDVIYRFFELFDLPNVPKSDLIAYSCKKGRVKVSPPYKAFLEEKLVFSLFHHPSLSPLWEKALGIETFKFLSHLIPETWILDNRELPPFAVIPGLKIKGKGIQDWKDLYPLTQKEREMVIKPSGFSPESWGSRGVIVGHDVSQSNWAENLDRSLKDFTGQPSILQTFHKGKRVKAVFMDRKTRALEEMECRVRLTPYYFVVEDSPRLGGVLATLCPQDKKKIHGMVDAIMIPCAVADR